jgi:hypothetical protein
MVDERALLAAERIERALARIEAAAGRQAQADAELERLRAAHETLRTRVAGAVSQIDRLLESPEGAV